MATDNATLSAWASEMYAHTPWLPRNMATYRPYICPFDLVIDQVQAGSTVLDIGCGSGLMLALLHRAGKLKQGIGFDTSEQAISAGQRMAKQFAPDVIDLRRLDVGEPWPEGLFDVVFLVDVLHHIPPPAQQSVIRQAMDKVAPGGKLVYKDMARRPIWRASLNRLHDLVMARQWIHYLPIEHVEAWLSANPLITKQDVNMLWYRHELRVFQRPANA